jgi:allophanate hydrolase subunit 2
VGGAFDRRSACLANALIANDPGEPCLELSLARLTLKVDVDTVLGLAGAPCRITVNGFARETPGRIPVKTCERVEIQPPHVGARVYLAAPFDSLPLAETRIAKGQTIPVSGRRGAYAKLACDPFESHPILRAMPGAQIDQFESSRFFSQPWEVSRQSDRVGIRLAGSGEPHNLELTSEPAGFGAIQITRDGTPIVLGPDGPTIGGYPKIGHVISADWDRLARLRPGDMVSFAPTNASEARRLAREGDILLERELRELAIAFRAQT